MEIILASALAIASVTLYRAFIEKKGTPVRVTGGLKRPLTELECEYMETLPLFGAHVPADQKLSQAHESLLLLDLVTEQWSDDGQSRFIRFTETGHPIAQSMRTS